jgi:hypothetical protein
MRRKKSCCVRLIVALAACIATALGAVSRGVQPSVKSASPR